MTTDEIAAAIEANMPGVTPGEWKAENRESMLSGYGQRANVGVWSQARYDRAVESEDDDPEDSAWLLGIWGVISEEDYANAAHIALCNPDNMSALLSERKAMRDEIERMRDALTKLKAAAEAQAVHNEETADHYRAAYAAFPSAEGHRIFAEEYEAKAASIRAALKDRGIA